MVISEQAGQAGQTARQKRGNHNSLAPSGSAQVSALCAGHRLVKAV